MRITRSFVSKSLASITLTSLALGCLPVPNADAQTNVANFGDDFITPMPKPGWSYLYNRNGAIGNSANYVALLGSRTGGTNGEYTQNGQFQLPQDEPGAYVFFGHSVTHPGRGSTQNNLGTYDVYAIAGYTVSTTGVYSITNSSVNRTNGSNGGSPDDEVRVFVNNNAPVVSTYFSSAINFNANLGTLAAGDTIYIAFGPHDLDFSDGLDTLNYTITRVDSSAAPESDTLALMVFPVVLSGFINKRKQKRRRRVQLG